LNPGATGRIKRERSCGAHPASKGTEDSAKKQNTVSHVERKRLGWEEKKKNKKDPPLGKGIDQKN